MRIDNIDSGWFAGLCVAGGAAIVKLAERLWRSPAEKFDDEKDFRQELREEVRSLRERTREVEREVTAYHWACIVMMEHIMTLRARIMINEDMIGGLRDKLGLPTSDHPKLPELPFVIEDGKIKIVKETQPVGQE